jgi:hypothetical protein
MGWLLFGIGGIVGGYLILQGLARATPQQIKRVLRWFVFIAAIGVFLYIFGTGRFQLLLGALLLLLPFLRQMRVFKWMAKAAKGPTQGQASEISTRFVDMKLDHDSGEMDGIVREGPNTGRALSDLDLAAVLDLYRNALAMDQNSAQVLESYLDRMRSEDWREKMGGGGEDRSAHTGNGASGGAMSVAEARAILGIDANASSEEIKQAHRRLMGQYHPDRGGSDYLAARINQAKDILLGK